MGLEQLNEEWRWIQDLKKGDHHAVIPLMDHYGESLMRYLVHLLGNRDNAEDVFQETWVKVIEKITSFQQEFSFSPWLFRIARNTAYDQLRERRKWRVLDWFRKPEDEDQPPLELESPENFTAPIFRKEIVQKLMGELTPEYREMLWLRFFQDFSYEEIAQLCRIPLGTVKSRLKRALDKAAAAYSKLEGCHVS